ncbi:hypothetical protein [Desulfobaculum bizertense]|uniref:Uncharacterized protein n=1 Tax=Desulfobaculum bizertense DSM 18034 TaxID=1121442 RepID=A0A1T4VQF1_9BACT|nr:hypothetical protein [Desulfobaculum bizertense]UIJ38174.1 hypothetical protein LWC08_01045 [Desulfobaculum bizertense]SKA66721.1 hypothetical protein SAMN02745702_00654 [Desulfobaculum bizertense DSM 18034]
MDYIIAIIILVALYFLLNKVILPKLGIKNCGSLPGSCKWEKQPPVDKEQETPLKQEETEEKKPE